MRHIPGWRTLFSVGIVLPLTIHPQSAAPPALAANGPGVFATAQGGLSAAEVQRLSQNAGRRVIVILRDQHDNLAARGAARANRLAAIAADQAPILQELAQVHAPRVRAFHLTNTIAATVSAAEATHLATNPAVLSVIPDAIIQGPQRQRTTPAGASSASALPPCTFTAELAPEALQLTNTAFRSAAIPQAQGIVTGTGVTVAFIADGLDPNNPDFIRPDGSPVFVDYQDFSGDGPNAPTPAGEAFGDASSIAAQGNETYNVNDYVNVAHRQPVACPQIKVLGVAPGASLMGLKAFGQTDQAFTSNFVQAIEYAVDHGADVINESFNGTAYPANNDDPVALADDAAVAAGVTIVNSTADAGTMGTLGTPSTDPNVISVGATTQYRIYKQVVDAGFQLGSGGWLDNNISSFSSGGIAQDGKGTLDVVAPGDSGWALCDPNPAVYQECVDRNGNPASIEDFGGTSESSPLTAGEAALIIQAYRQTHGGASPSPALIKGIIKSTATDLGIPSYEQGAGLIDAFKAVRAALSYHDANGAPTPVGNALLAAPNALSAIDAPSTHETFTIQVTNTGAQSLNVAPSVQTLGPTTSSANYTVALDQATDATFSDGFGTIRSYVEQDFSVPANAQRLDAAIAWDVVSQPTSSPVRLTLFDPQGRFAAFSTPQDIGAPFSNSGYGHVDVRNPLAGTWRAIIWTKDSASGYHGPVQLGVSTANFVAAGTVMPASRLLASGQTGSFTIAMTTPAQPGDESANVAIHATDSAGTAHDAGDIPVVLRSLVPLGPSGGSFGGTLTGGNGRFSAPGQTLSYQFDVPAGLHDLELNTTITDTNYNLEGVLVDPNGTPLDVQSTVTSLGPTGQPASYTNTLQFFRRDPQPGRWQFIFFINDNISGAQTTLPFTAHITFNGVVAQASGVPNDPGITLPAGVTATARITVTNTGNTTKDFFVDPRLAQSGLIALGGLSTPLPVTIFDPVPFFIAPPESTDLTIAVESMSPTVPISMDVANQSGAPPFGSTGSPDIEAASFPDPLSGNYAAVASSTAPEVAPGSWAALPTEVGPYPGGATPSTAQLGAIAIGQQFDAAVSPSTGDEWALLTGQPSPLYAPLTLAPGASGTITVRIVPSAAPGTTVSGFLYVDTYSAITIDGDELIAIPYSYTVG